MMDDSVRPWAMRKSVWLTEVGITPCQSSYGEWGRRSFISASCALSSRGAHGDGRVVLRSLRSAEPALVRVRYTRPDWSNRPAFSLYQAFIKAYP